MKHSLLLFASLLSLASPQLASAASADPVALFDAAKMEFPESIAIDKAGNCYLSMVATGVIKKVTPAGAQSVYATIPDDFIAGLAFDGSDTLFVAGGAGIWKVTPAGVVSLFSAIPGAAINDLALAPDGALYTTYQGDDTSGSLWKVDAKGVAKLWCSSPLFAPVKSFMPAPVGINGVAVDPQNRFVYVDVVSAGRIVEIKINPDGSAGATRVVVENAALIGCDGLRVDDRGNFYTAVNLQNRITKITPDGKVTDLASGGLLNFPTSLALDTRNGKTAIYVCNDGDFFFGATQSNQGLLKITNPEPSRMIQVSTRATIGAGGDVVISGFVVEGTAAKTLLVRAVGPTLSAFGVTNALADPQVALYGAASATTPIASNDNWGGDAAVAAATPAAGAFALANATSKDAALLVTLAPGTYTTRVSGVGGATGSVLLEIYEVP
jgi:sugar lactone lactonase YvrE